MGRIAGWVMGLLILLCLQVGQAAAQETSLGGDWWISIGGADKGAGALTFGVPSTGVFEVSGNLITLAGAWPASVAAGGALRIDYRGEITGNLLLEFDGFGPVGELEVTAGGTDARFQKLWLKGYLTYGEMSPILVRIKGQRMPASPPILTGRSIQQGLLKGPGLLSRTLDIVVGEEEDLKFPFYVVTGGGSVRVDGSDEDVIILGVFGRTPTATGTRKNNIFGWLWSSDPTMDEGPLVGNLRKSEGKAPEFSASVKGNRRFQLSAKLKEPVSPIISVTPDSIDFGTVEVGESLTRTFTVTNIGSGILDGEATVDGAGFSVTGGSPYSLAAGESSPVTIEFSPTNSDTFFATVSFTGGGGTTRSVTGKGE
ncbi:MAG: choice-of-anchor D domain-containing protein [bacterium]